MDFSKLDGLVPAVVQDDETNEVLMVGFMNQESLDRTVATGYTTFYSRTRNALWTKGETSGNRLRVVRLLVDCDEDTLLVRARRVALPLVPEHAANAIARMRCDDAIPGIGRTIVAIHIGAQLPHAGLLLGGERAPGFERGKILREAVVARHEGHEVRAVVEVLARHPGFRTRSAPGIVDDAHRHAK